MITLSKVLEDLSLDFQSPHKHLAVLSHTCNPRTWEMETAGSLGLAGPPVWSNWWASDPTERPCLKTKGCGWRRHPASFSGLHTHVHRQEGTYNTNTHIHTYMLIALEIKINFTPWNLSSQNLPVMNSFSSMIFCGEWGLGEILHFFFC